MAAESSFTLHLILFAMPENTSDAYKYYIVWSLEFTKIIKEAFSFSGLQCFEFDFNYTASQTIWEAQYEYCLLWLKQ